MQPYVTASWGFDSSVLTKKEFDQVLDLDDPGMQLKSYTEDGPGHGWCAVVLHSIGRDIESLTGDKGFYVHRLVNAVGSQGRAEAVDNLIRLGFDHYKDLVELIVHCYEC